MPVIAEKRSCVCFSAWSILVEVEIEASFILTKLSDTAEELCATVAKCDYISVLRLFWFSIMLEMSLKLLLTS